MTTIFIGLGLPIAPGSNGGVTAFTLYVNGEPLLVSGEYLEVSFG